MRLTILARSTSSLLDRKSLLAKSSTARKSDDPLVVKVIRDGKPLEIAGKVDKRPAEARFQAL